ncbi:hypothetical protein SEA_MUFASA8_101 [Arthrobacter phage Mufasa8]|uniref:Uncharacterized protein n=1 Tax=Arthrobacter phage Mufasa8 TaxID=2656526 RepID=A0A649VMH7_9CAUD|nr:hypothetical protein HYQ08_gp101 [Arthrobacter phage Mufasa8]QGJ93548.1 hypothetical protein SEA_MUFASA8_101 [Arthrobacter phage Mufasa8]
MDRFVTPAEALFAIYRSDAEYDGITVYEVPTGGQPSDWGTLYTIRSADHRCEDQIHFGFNEEGLPVITRVEMD